jgi:hypothetical protein
VIAVDPGGVDVEPTDVGIRGTADTLEGVGIAGEHRARPGDDGAQEIGVLVVVGEIDVEPFRDPPVERDGVIVEILVAIHAGPAGVQLPRHIGRIVDHEGDSALARLTAGRAHGGVVVGAGEERAGGIEEGAVVFDVDETADAGDRGGEALVARDDADGELRRGGVGGVVRCERDRGDALGVAVVEPGEAAVEQRVGRDARAEFIAAFAGDAKGHAVVGGEGERAEEPALVLIVGLAPAGVLLVDGGHGNGEFFRDHDLVGAELPAIGGDGAVAHRIADPAAVAVRRGQD